MISRGLPPLAPSPYFPMELPIPINDYILVEPVNESDTKKKGGPIIPDSAQHFTEAIVLDIGPDTCLPQYMEKGIGPLTSKRQICPGLKVGSTIHYRKVAEERLTMDAAYRKSVDGRSVVLVKILDCVHQ